ncbi:14828_t:CDS:2 [Cetraspora pellucida]|uniref:14828_t:CDS:1 n=1 Tax=Cetraspora pellucida TaxID=1433469 RepID=A0ACA9PQJ0_9GLOM|nr:14828_t:CDS:2 [Cetraspora pellucida]
MPKVRVSFISGKLHTIILKLPIALSKFNEPIQLNGAEFFARWKQIGAGPREKQVVFHSNAPINLSGARTIILGFKFEILEEVDPNPTNIVGASVLHTSGGGMFGCLMRLEPNIEAQMYRLTVRTTNEAVTNEICTLLEPLLANIAI